MMIISLEHVVNILQFILKPAGLESMCRFDFVKKTAVVASYYIL